MPGDRISAVESIPGTATSLILPGFIDLHCHAVWQVARTHARSGTTEFLATTMTAPLSDIELALKAVAKAATPPDAAAATVLGVHLEGPFISRDKLGAQPDFVVDAEIPLTDRLMGFADIRVVTCAPEADPHGAMARWLVTSGLRVQIGHSSCDYDTASKTPRERETRSDTYSQCDVVVAPGARRRWRRPCPGRPRGTHP